MIKPLVIMLRQDDPHRCTAAKLVKFNLVRRVYYPHKDTLVLNPFGKVLLSRQDSSIARFVCAIDCSWVRTDEVFKSRKIFIQGLGRRLPLLFAANPTNYSRIGILSTAEALSGSLYILGFKETAAVLMNKFKWGHTFLELNSNLLEEYSNAKNVTEIADLEKSYFPQLHEY